MSYAIRKLAFVGAAGALHIGATLAYHPAPREVEITKVTEIELAPVPPPPPPPPPPEEAAPAAPAAATKHVASAPPAAARAGALLTAKEAPSPTPNHDVLDFVTDPNGTTYGSGVVARGGTADHGKSGATLAGTGTGTAPIAPKAQALTPEANLGRRARLGEPNACAGFYPHEANADVGAVTLTVVVRADGTVASSSVLSESPAGQGFAKAARSCMQGKHFEPALDRSGTAVDTATTIKLRFDR